MRGSITFLASKCALDRTSGAAIAVRNLLEGLAAAGFHCETFTAAHFDPPHDVPLGPLLGAKAAQAESKGKLLVRTLNQVCHRIFLTRSTQSPLMDQDEKDAMQRHWRSRLATDRPDLVLTYGSGRMVEAMIADARSLGVRVVFYLATAEYTTASAFASSDRVFCASHFLQAHYRQTLGLETDVLWPVLTGDQFLAPGAPAVAAQPEMRRLGFITVINPVPPKGLTLFVRLARLAWRERRDLKFLAVEGRMPRSQLQDWGIDLGAYPNVWWIPTQEDVKAVYQRTTVLLFPSFWQEGLGQSVIEAQLSGIPVVASRRGGIPEALNGGGITLDIPAKCTEHYGTAPDAATLRAWLAALARLWDDDDAYREAVARARPAAAPFLPQATTAAAIAYFEALLADRPAR